MARRQQAVNAQEPIVDLNTGVASDYFKRVILDRGIGLDDLNGRQILGGTGIDGGGELADGDITLDANVQEILDAVSSTHGVILYRGASDWVPLSPGTNGYVLTTHGPGADPTWAVVSSAGTVTSVSVVSANGFAGSVATATTTPAITISTTITGMLKGNGTAISAAVAGTDYLAPAAIGVTVQGYDADLGAVAGLATTGLISRTGAGAMSTRTLTAPAAGITVTNGDGVSGNPTLALANDLSALEALTGTNTIYYRSGTDTWSAVTIGTNLTFSSGTLSASGGSGGSGDIPTLTGNPASLAVKASTSGTPGTGAFTPSSAVSGYKAWSAVYTGWIGLVRFEDGSDWEHCFSYWNGTTLSRASTQMYESSTGSQLNLSSSSTATLLMDLDTMVDQLCGGQSRGLYVQAGSTSGSFTFAAAGTNITSPSALTVGTATYVERQIRQRYSSATTANAATGWTGTYSLMSPSSTAGFGGGGFFAEFDFNQLPTAPRLIVGLGGHGGGATEPSAVTSPYVWVGFDSTDTNMQFLTNDGSGGGTKTDTGIPRTTGAWYNYASWNNAGSLDWHQLLVREDDGSIYYKKSTTDTPVTGSLLTPNIRAMLTATTGTAFVFDLGGMRFKTGR